MSGLGSVGSLGPTDKFYKRISVGNTVALWIDHVSHISFSLPKVHRFPSLVGHNQNPRLANKPEYMRDMFAHSIIAG